MNHLLANIPQIQDTNVPNFFLLAGPCVVENEALIFEVAQTLKTMTERLKIPFVFKSSYKKANRSKGSSFTGIGDQTALEILGKVRKELKIPVVTDVHSAEDCRMAAPYVDILQIPAFLCRQSDLLEAAAQTGKAVNIKKGQFMSPDAMEFAVEKVRLARLPHGTMEQPIFLTERGTTFGYTDLVVDFRSIPMMQKFAPTILDVTHSLQQPNQKSGVTGGLPHLITCIAQAGIAAGADGLFIETHPKPSEAKSDGANMLALDQMEILLERLTKIRQAVQSFL